MKRFEEKWQECAAQARAADAEPDELPFGFADRVLNQWHRVEPPQETGDAVWMQLGLRTLLAMSAVFVVFALIQWNTESQTAPLRPTIEVTIIDYSKLL